MAAHGPTTVAAILVAGGSGQRLGATVPKAFAEIDGHTLLELAATRLLGHPRLRKAVVVAPSAWLDVAAQLTGLPCVAGGAQRQDSVAAGLAALGAADAVDDADVMDDALESAPDFVLVHDVARPFVPVQVVDAVLSALDAGADAVVPVVPIHDTVRRVEPDGTLAGVLDRAALVAVQTPQGFRLDVLREAHRHAGELAATDDAALVEALGGTVVAVPGSDDSFKITTPADLLRARAVAESTVAADPGGDSQDMLHGSGVTSAPDHGDTRPTIR